MRKLSVEKIGSLLSIFHTREKQHTAAVSKPGTSRTELLTADTTTDIEELIQAKVKKEVAVRRGSTARIPDKIQLSEEDWEWNVPKLEKEIKSLCQFKTFRNQKAPSWVHEVGSVMEGKNLSQMNFSYSDLSLSFIRCDLRWTNFDGCKMKACLFDYSEARACSFGGVEAKDCTFVGADFEGADFSGSRFTSCKFIRCNLKGVVARDSIFFQCDFTMSEMSFMSVNFATKFMEPVGWSASRRLEWNSAQQPFVMKDDIYDRSIGSGADQSRYAHQDFTVTLREGVPKSALISLPPPQVFNFASFDRSNDDAEDGAEDDDEHVEQTDSETPGYMR